MATALITGASSGLGREFARLFAADGHDVVLIARSREKLRALADELEARHNIKAHVEPADLSEPAAAKTIFERVSAMEAPVEFLVNNAGFGSNGPFAEQDAARELGMVQVNISSLVHLTHLFLPGMIERKGRILNVASTAGFQAGPYMATYYATKAFVLHFSEALSHELKKGGVTVTAHCPGATLTGFGAIAGNDKSNLFKLAAMEAADVARHGYDAMKAGQVIAVSGFNNRLGAFLVRFSPRWVLRWVVGWLNS